MKCALLFPGQGSQCAGMGRSLYDTFPQAREIFEEANAVLGFDLKTLMFEGPEEKLKETRVTQPAIFAVSAAAFRILEERTDLASRDAAYAAGHSLGEYSALFAADCFDFKTGLELVRARGGFLQEACAERPGAMAAVLGAEREALAELCRQAAAGGVCQMVNFNAPGQIVAAGEKAAVERLGKLLAGKAGSKFIPLNVSGAFHSSLMSGAAGRMAGALAPVPIRDPRIPVLTNCDAEVTLSGAAIREKLVRQIDHPVLWEDSVRQMIASGVELFIEAGPGRVLSGILRKIDRKQKVVNVEDEASLNAALNAINAKTGGVL